MKWVSVKDRLPELGSEAVLVFHKDERVLVATFTGPTHERSNMSYQYGAWSYTVCMCCDDWGGLGEKYITHWAEITPPKENNEVD